ncbi:MAG: O-antigen ligase family protein [Planctomycetes bacterium]|nr:O-antigen ligase family protein [Planctomycetota bacterium]
MWLAALPLALIPACWLWWWASLIHPGMVRGRSAELLLIVGCALAAWVCARPPDMQSVDTTTTRGRIAKALAHPSTWCAAAILWQAAVWIACAPVREPGSLWLVERTGAWITALGVAAWLARADLPRAAWGLAGAAAGILILASFGQHPHPEQPVGAVLSLASGQSLGALSRIGEEMPFGNANFNVGGALPLLGIGLGLWLRERQHQPSRFFHALLILGWLAAVALGTGTISGDATRAVWPTAAAMVVMLAVLSAPRWMHAPLAGIGVCALIAGQLAIGCGWYAIEHPSPSTLQRIELWRAAVEAIDLGPLVGHGVGTTIAVLPQQPSFAAAWLAVPSYAEHAHHEVLEALLGGGGVLVALLGGALFTTLWPLWVRRSEALPMALLVGWTGVLTHALIESHLSQPGPLVLLALLAGVSWAVAREGWPAPITTVAGRRAVRIGCVLAALVLAGMAMREVFDGGSPPSIQTRADWRMAAREKQGDWLGFIAEAKRLRARLGPLADLPYREARARLRIGERDRAEALALEQARIVPAHGWNLGLLRRLEAWRIAHGQSSEAAALHAARGVACARAQAILEQVPPYPGNRRKRDQLTAEIAAFADGAPTEISADE